MLALGWRRALECYFGFGLAEGVRMLFWLWAGGGRWKAILVLGWRRELECFFGFGRTSGSQRETFPLRTRSDAGHARLRPTSLAVTKTQIRRCVELCSPSMIERKSFFIHSIFVHYQTPDRPPQGAATRSASFFNIQASSAGTVVYDTLA